MLFNSLSYDSFQIRKLSFQDDAIDTPNKDRPDDSEELYALWISRDPEEPGEGGRKFGSLTLSSTMFHENSGLIASNSAIVECEKSFGQEIIMKSAKLKQNEDDKNIEGNTLSENGKVDRQENPFVNDDYNTDLTKALDCHPIAKFWKNQIEKAKALDTSNIQCQVGGTYEESYQTLDVS